MMATAAAALMAVGGLPALASPALAAPAAVARQATVAQQAAAGLVPEVSEAARYDTSKPLSQIADELAQAEKAAGPARSPNAPGGASEQRRGALPHSTANPDAKVGSSQVQTDDVGVAAFPDFGVNFEGVGNLDAVLPRIPRATWAPTTTCK
ncbi:MAG TPA: hypothetical protein VHI50_13025 [Micromonosporaceae bacterium]|jgi:hypothetical protein|nr:hypothetical protein [Micromonosporaceae bacterium]